MLEEILTTHDIQMTLDLGVLTGKAVDFILAQATPQTGVQFAGELIVEFREQLGVEKKVGGGGKFVGDGVEENLRTVVLVGFGGALFGFHGENAQSEDVDAVAEEDSFAAW